MRDHVRLVLVLIMALIGTEAAAQQPAVALEPEGADQYSPMLDRPARLKLRQATLSAALNRLSQTSGVPLAFSPSLVGAETRRVTCDCDSLTVRQALDQLLHDTKFAYRELRGEVLIYQDLPAIELPAVRRPSVRLASLEGLPADLPDTDSAAAEITIVQDTVTIRGRVVDASSNEPVAQVIVNIVGTRHQTTTNAAGAFVLRGLVSGERVLSFRRIGYRAETITIDLVAGQDTSIVVPITLQPIPIGEVVSTATGERRKLEVGHSSAGISNVDSLMQITPVTTTSELIKHRIPGLLAVTNSGAVGAPTRLRVRGISSIESSNEPVIIVDGIRIANTAATSISDPIFGGVYGGSAQAGANDLSMRLDDLDPNMIESVEVMKGPSASTMYGAEAANGVIIIKTKRGFDGPPRWNIYTDYRQLAQFKDYVYPIRQLGINRQGGLNTPIPTCDLTAQFAGTCIPVEGETVGYNMLRDPNVTPQGRGFTRSLGANVAGGNQGLQYFVGGTVVDKLGTTKMPEVNRRWIERFRGGKIKEELIRPNALRRTSMNARITGRLGSSADFSLGANFISQKQRVGANGMAGLTAVAPRFPNDTTPATKGWETWYGEREQNVRHIIGNASANWRPAWRDHAFFFNVTYGWDFSIRDDEYYAPKGSCYPLCQGDTDQGVLGYISSGRHTDFVQTLNIGSAFNLPITSSISSSTRVGFNFNKHHSYHLFGSANDLQVGYKLFGATGTKHISDLGDTRATAGWYLEEQINLRQDRLFATLGLRQDAGSALGETQRPIFVKWNFSWLASEEDFFPFRDYISMFRVRFATGSAGVMPATLAKNRTYQMANDFLMDNGTANGMLAEIITPGDRDLRPEHSREYEGGFDIDLFDRRLTLDLTWFKKYTTDAIARGPTAGSAGIPESNTLIGNLGDVENHGYEFGATLSLLETSTIAVDLVGHISSRNNKLTRLDEGAKVSFHVPTPADVGFASKNAIGYPLFGRWAFPILGWWDRNGDGKIDLWEIAISDSLEYVGPTEPRYVGYLGSQIGLFDKRLMIAANFAYSSGLVQVNEVRKDMHAYTPEVQLSEMDLRSQACMVAAILVGWRRATDWCYMETVKLLRLQDLSVRYSIPPSLARRVGANAGTLTFSTTNLKHWSNYKGRDPDINTAPFSGNERLGGQTFGAPREYGIRLQLHF